MKAPHKKPEFEQSRLTEKTLTAIREIIIVEKTKTKTERITALCNDFSAVKLSATLKFEIPLKLNHKLHETHKKLMVRRVGVTSRLTFASVGRSEFKEQTSG